MSLSRDVKMKGVKGGVRELANHSPYSEATIYRLWQTDRERADEIIETAFKEWKKANKK